MIQNVHFEFTHNNNNNNNTIKSELSWRESVLSKIKRNQRYDLKKQYKQQTTYY